MDSQTATINPTTDECQDEGEHDGPRFFFGARTICKQHCIARGIY